MGDLNRREFLRRAAATGAVAAWAAPLVRTIAATPAYAQTNGTPAGDHSACVSACNEAASPPNSGSQPNGCKQAGTCNEQCRRLCPPGGQCCSATLTSVSGWNSNCTPKVSC